MNYGTLLALLVASFFGAHQVLVVAPAANEARCAALGEAWVNDVNCDIY